MAQDKKGFLLYTDQIGIINKLVLKDRQEGTNNSGELFLHIMQYVNDENPEPVNFIVDMAFEQFKVILKRDLKKYETYIEKQVENGKKGGRPKKEETQITQPFIKEPKKADSDNVSVNDNVSVSVNDSVKENINTASPFNFFYSLLSYGFDKELCCDWLKVRKTKKATNTKTAFNKFIIEVEKCSLDKNKILETCIEKSWSGFKSEWINNLNINFDKKITNEQFTNITAELRRNNPNI